MKFVKSEINKHLYNSKKIQKIINAMCYFCKKMNEGTYKLKKMNMAFKYKNISL